VGRRGSGTVGWGMSDEVQPPSFGEQEAAAPG